MIACNNDGVWNEQGDQLTFAIPAAWYQTLLFKSLAFGSVLCLCYVLYRYKIAEQAAVMRALLINDWRRNASGTRAPRHAPADHPGKQAGRRRCTDQPSRRASNAASAAKAFGMA